MLRYRDGESNMLRQEEKLLVLNYGRFGSRLTASSKVVSTTITTTAAKYSHTKRRLQRRACA